MTARSPRDIDTDSTVYPSHQQCAADTSDNCHADTTDTLACGDAVRSHRGGDGNQLLIFTKGSRTYTPHQIGIKRMPCCVSELMAQQHADAHAADGADDNVEDDDSVDVTVELHGHIIGMNLSPDHRSLTVSRRLIILPSDRFPRPNPYK